MVSAPTRLHLGVPALLAAAALWSLSGPLIKTLSDTGLSGLKIACLRSLIGGLVFLPLVWPTRRTLLRVHVAWPIGAVLSFTLMTLTFVIATTRIAAATAIILQYTAPMIVVLLAPLLLRERPARRELAALGISMLGVGVIFLGTPGGELGGTLIALASGVGYGLVILTLRGLRGVNPLLVTAMNALGSGLLLCVPVALFDSFAVTPAQLGWLTLLAVVQFTLPYVLFSYGVSQVEAHRASQLVLLETILNPLYTWLLKGEVPPSATLLGGPLILAGVLVWVALPRTKPPADPGPDRDPSDHA